MVIEVRMIPSLDRKISRGLLRIRFEAKNIKNSPPFRYCFRVVAFQIYILDVLVNLCDGTFMTSLDGTLTTFAYVSHYFQRQNSVNSETS